VSKLPDALPGIQNKLDRASVISGYHSVTDWTNYPCAYVHYLFFGRCWQEPTEAWQDQLN
jgi:hypothetical protein